MFIEFMREWETQPASSPPVPKLTRPLQEIKDPAPVAIEEVDGVGEVGQPVLIEANSPRTALQGHPSEAVCECGCRFGNHYLQQVGWPACSTCTECRGFREAESSKIGESETTNKQEEIP
jgi:hypothetical protein